MSESAFLLGVLIFCLHIIKQKNMLLHGKCFASFYICSFVWWFFVCSFVWLEIGHCILYVRHVTLCPCFCNWWFTVWSKKFYSCLSVGTVKVKHDLQSLDGMSSLRLLSSWCFLFSGPPQWSSDLICQFLASVHFFCCRSDIEVQDCLRPSLARLNYKARCTQVTF